MKKRTRRVLIFCTLFALVAGLAVTCGPLLGVNLPGWDKIFETAGLRPQPASSQSDGEVHFIDVGQADCTLLVSGEGAVLVDGGNNADAGLIISYLRGLGIEKLDYIIATHHHEDHIGGLDKVVEAFKVGAVIMGKSGGATLTRTYEDLLLAIDTADVPVIEPRPGNSYEAGGIRFTVLGPAGNYSNENDRSVVIRADCAGASVFLGGDSEAALDEIIALPDIRSDIYKAGHHGSKTSNPRDLLSKIDPEYIVIPVGQNNSYGHPSPAVLELFDELGVPLYRTDVDGSVVFLIEAGKITVKTDAE